MTSTAMTGNAIREALEPISKIAEFFADEQEWRDHDTIMVAPMENLREAQHLTVGDLRRARTAYDARGSGVKAWRCFHCDDEFTSEHDARLHFGREEGATPACQIKGSEHGLVAALRQAENEASEAWMAIHNETTDAARAYHAQAARHRQQLTTIEQVGYDRGLADARAYPETLGLSPVAVGEAGARALSWVENASALLKLNEKGAVSHPVPGLAVSLLRSAIDLLSTHTAAGAGPVGEAGQRLDSEKAQEWPAAKKALWKVVTSENLNDGHYINAYRLTDKLYAAIARPVEEPGVVELWATVYGRAVSAEYEVKRLTLENNRLTDAAIDAEAALAETRERLEKETKRIDQMFERFLDKYQDCDAPVSTDDVADYLSDVRRAVAALSTQESSAALADGKEAGR